MFIGRIKKRVFLITCLAAIVALIIPCPSFSAKSEKKYLINETELQSELMAFADRLASYLHQALRDFERAPGMQEMRPMVQKDVVISSASAIAIAAGPDPGTALLDMVAMVSMGRSIYETHWLPRRRDTILPIVEVFRKGEGKIWARKPLRR